MLQGAEQKVTPSYVHGGMGPPLRGSTIGDALDRVAAEHGEVEAVVSVFQDVRLTYRELQSEAETLAAGLIDLGLRPGDRLGIWSVNCVEWTVIQFAAAKAGVILVTINPAYRTRELEQVLEIAGCVGLVVGRPHKGSDFIEMLESIVPDLREVSVDLRSERLPSLKYVVTLESSEGLVDYASLREAGRRAGPGVLPAKETLQFDDPINIQFTSGTTGTPKGVTLSHHNILNNGIQTGAAAGIGIGDRVCIPVPLFHCFGMVVGNLACLGHAATAVYPGPSFDPLEVMEAVSGERCTHLYGVPTMMISILGHQRFAEFDFSSLRGGIMGGAPCAVETMKAVISDLHMPEVTIIYGMTETSPVSFQTRLDDPFSARVETVGRVMPHIEAKIVDENDRVVSLGQPGQLCTRGYSVMSGYWGQEDLTQDVLGSDRWMHTGDLATIDADGYCRIIGRSKDIIIRGGENISPREIEEFLYTHPDVRNVEVVGIPDVRLGEEVCVWIIARDGSAPTEDDIREFCRGKIAHYKIPRYIRLVDEFPMTASGKVQKFKIRDEMVALLSDGPKS